MYDQEELKKIPGIKIRRQYCVGMLTIWITFVMFLTILYLLESHPIEDLKFYLLPLTVLSLPMSLVFLNRFFIGEIACVINEDGVYYKQGLIEWGTIERVKFDIEGKGRYLPAVTSIDVIGGKGWPRMVEHVPYFAVKKMKKFKPEIEVTFTDRAKRFRFWNIVCIVIFGLIAPFVGFFLRP